MSLLSTYFPLIAVKNNFTAIIAPTVNDDSSLGYSAGSRWTDTVLGITYTAISVGVGAAVWHSNDALGSGQTWQDVVLSRAIGVIYTNTTGRTISVMGDVVGSNTVAAIYTLLIGIDGVTSTSAVTAVSGLAIPAHLPFTLTVPAGATYDISGFNVPPGGAITLLKWSELR